MEKNELIKELLSELAYRSNEGYPILENREHISILAEILDEFGLGSIKNELIENLLEAEPKSKTDDLYKSIGGTGYVLAKDFDKWEKNKDAYTGDKFTKGKDGQYTKQGGDDTADDTPKTGTAVDVNSDYAKAEREREKRVNGNDNKESSKAKQEKLVKADSEKVKSQILMTTADAKKQQKGVGLGTPESRTGESVTVYAGQKIQQLIKDGSSYEEARVQVEKELLEIAKDSKNVLTSEWVKSGLAAFDHLNATYGFKNIKHFAWDTPEGNTLVSATDHGTSADMFIQLNDGTTVGVSLKKDFKVFIVNGGYKKAMKEFEEKTGISFSENCQIGHYMNMRDSILSESVSTIEGNEEFFKEKIESILSDSAEFEKTFGKRAEKNRKSFLVSKKSGISISAAKAMSDEERDEVMKTITSEDVLSYMKDNSDTSNDRIKFMANIFKRKDVDSKFRIYSDLRGLDNEMTENMFKDIKSSTEKEEKLKEKIIEDTHIIDTLFPKEPLGDFKTVFGEDPAVEMTRGSIVSIFGIKDLWEQYNNAETAESKQQIREQIENEILSKLRIEKKSGVPVIAINITNEDGTESTLPLYKLGVRTRGIGDSPTLEVSQAVFGSLALKNGNTDVNSWDDKDRETVVNGEVNDILSNFEDDKNLDIDELSPEEQEELIERIKLLESYNSNSKKLQALKKSLSIN